MAKEIFILGGKRTPMTAYVGALKDVQAIDLGAAAERGALEADDVMATEIKHKKVLVIEGPLTEGLLSEDIYDLYNACNGVLKKPRRHTSHPI